VSVADSIRMKNNMKGTRLSHSDVVQVMGAGPFVLSLGEPTASPVVRAVVDVSAHPTDENVVLFHDIRMLLDVWKKYYVFPNIDEWTHSTSNWYTCTFTDKNGVERSAPHFFLATINAQYDDDGILVRSFGEAIKKSYAAAGALKDSDVGKLDLNPLAYMLTSMVTEAVQAGWLTVNEYPKPKRERKTA